MAKSKNMGTVSNPHYDDLYSQGGVVAPSGATLRKFFGAPKQRKRQKIPTGEPGTLSEGTLRISLYGAIDYHDAMMDNIEKMHEGESVWTFRKLPKSQRKIDMHAFEYIQKIREIYGVDKRNIYYRQKLKEIVKENQEGLETPLALKILALEEIDKKWFKGYLPSEMYGIIKKQAEKSLDSADKRYFSKSGKDLQIRKKALDYIIAELKK